MQDLRLLVGGNLCVVVLYCLAIGLRLYKRDNDRKIAVVFFDHYLRQVVAFCSGH